MALIAELFVGLMYADEREEVVEMIESARKHTWPIRR